MLRGLAVLLFAASAVAFLAPWNWLGDMLVNFRVQYVIFGILACAAATVLREWRASAAALLAALLSLPAAWSHIVPQRTIATSPPAEASGRAPLRVVSANLFFLNGRHGDVVQWARSTSADALVFIEVTDEWARALEPLRGPFPHVIAGPTMRGMQLMVFSRWPLAPAEVLRTADDPPFGLQTRLRRGALECDLIAVHVSWPMTPARAQRRARQLDHLAQAAADLRGPHIVLGDFNTSPFSPVFERLLARGALTDIATGSGWRPTWPRFLPLVGIEIDHVLLGGSARVLALRRAIIPGSDHRALIADLGI